MQEDNRNVAQVNIPNIQGRKTLLIGLGSSGARVCNQIIERLLWTYDSPANVPWLHCMVLETAPIAAHLPVHDYAQFIQLMIDAKTYATFIANPQLYHPQLAFADWNIPSLTEGADSITQGANNTRILGRLAFLFPNNFTAVRKAVTDALMALQGLTATEATSSFNTSLENPVNVILPDDLHVYVVGTLCGGTASGSFIDMGYMLRTLEGYRLKGTTGIFLLPSTAEQNNLYIGNAYAALVELNHFSTDSTQYKAQLPHRRNQPTVAPQGMAPYEYVYLVQSRGESQREYAQLVTATADYLYADLIGNSAVVRDADRTNISNFFRQRDFWGATQKYFSFGLSTIEFPHTKVAKACALRLSKIGFQQLMGGTKLTEMQANARLSEIPLSNRNAMMERLLDRGSSRIGADISQVLSQYMEQVRQTDEGMTLARSVIGAAFDGGSQVLTPHPKLPSRIVPQTIEQNEEKTKQELMDSIKKGVRELLAGGSEAFGLVSLSSFLIAIEDALRNSKTKPANVSQDQVENDLIAQVNQAQEQVRKCRRSCWARRSLGRHINNFGSTCNELYQFKLRCACADIIDTIYDEALKLVETARKRLENTQCGLIKEVSAIVTGMEGLYSVTDVPSGTTDTGWVPVVNGTELYTGPQTDQSGTVDQEYWYCIRKTKEQQKLAGHIEEVEPRLARESVQVFLITALDDLLADPDVQRRFDVRRGSSPTSLQHYDDQQLFNLARPARTIFVPLGQRSIIDRLMDKPVNELKQTLIDAEQKAKLFLDWNAAHPRYFPQEQKSYAYVFYNSNDARASEFHQQLENAQVLHGDNRKEMDILSRHQVLLLEEQGAFSLGTIASLLDEQPSAWKSNYLNPVGLASLHARGDIADWITWARVDEEMRMRLRGLFLAAVAIEIIKFISVNQYRFTYPPRRPSDLGYVDFSRDLDEAAQNIKRGDLGADIELQVNHWKKEQGPAEVVRRIDQFIQDSDRKFTEAGSNLSPQEIEVYLLDYLFSDQELENIYHTTFYPDDVIQSYLGNPEADGRQAYVCPQCNGKLGYNVNALYTYEQQSGHAVRVRRCSYCNYNL